MASYAMLRGGQRGFTLLEMAIVLILVGLMMIYAFQIVGVVDNQRCMEITRDQLAKIRHSVDLYVRANKRYPRPAGAGHHPSSAAYGKEVASDSDPSIAIIPGSPELLKGVVPFVTLGLTGDYAIDCWGHKFSYVITRPLATWAGFASTSNAGGAQIRHGTLSTHTTLLTNAAYVVVSHGEQAIGAVARGYTGPPPDCNAQKLDASEVRIDKENCDSHDTIFFDSEYNDGEVETAFFDDLIVYGSKPKPDPVYTPPPAGSCSGPIAWGGNCQAPAVLTLNGIALSVTNVMAGYTGVAISTCTNGVRSTIGACLPVGACTGTNPRDGSALILLPLTAVNYGIGVCKKYSCCSGGTLNITTISACFTPLDLPGVATCP